MMRLGWMIALFALAACQTPAPAAPFYTLVDLTGEYTRFYDRTTEVPTSERIAAFKTEMNARFPGFYDVARMEGVSQESYDASIARSFDAFPELRARYTATAANFESMIEPARSSFAAAFPDVAPIGDIYLVHSLGEMDGGTRDIAGATYVVFGADVMARVYQPGNERPFFHHELFHVYHQQFFGECEQIWCALWSEGLAVYVAHQLNPDADDVALSLTAPRPIRPEVDANLQYAVCQVRARLESESIDDYRPLFYGRSNLDGLPPRAGYYVGYLVASELGRTRTPQALAHLSVEQARPLVEATLAGMATCPAN